MDKAKYITPYSDIITFDAVDVIITSGNIKGEGIGEKPSESDWD